METTKVVKSRASQHKGLDTPTAEPKTDVNETPKEESSQSSVSQHHRVSWRLGIIAALALAILSLYPQIDLWSTLGSQWEGAFASVCYDEEFYAAYVNGLALGRSPNVMPLEVPDLTKVNYQSTMVSQIVPAYFLFMLVKLLGLSVSQAFILLTPLMAFVSTLLLYYLLQSITRDEEFSAAGALGILIFGTLAARHSVLFGWMRMNWYGSFLFLRRFPHAVSFPLLLGFIILTWQSLIAGKRSRWFASSLAAGILFGVLVFSYFYFWTTALAWLVCLLTVWLLRTPVQWRETLTRIAPTALVGGSTLIVYLRLLSKRDPQTDSISALQYTHAPDLHRAPLWIGVIVILLLLWAVRKNWAEWRQPVWALAFSLALTSVAVFNQQIITGRSLQPDHFEIFSVNYLSLLGAILTVWIILGRDFSKHVPRWVSVTVALAALAWGIVEMDGVTSNFRGHNIARDRLMPVAKALTQLAARRGKEPAQREVVFSPDVLVVSESIASVAPQAPFMSMNLPIGAKLSLQDWHERYFQFLYYCGTTPEDLLAALKSNEMVATMSSFGYDRYNPAFTQDFHPPSDSEIQAKVREYADYVAGFNVDRAVHPKISYVVLYNNTQFDFRNLDRWYRRDVGEVLGAFTLYQLEPIATGAPADRSAGKQ